MTRQQTTVIWLGLVLVAFNILLHISELKSVIFAGASFTPINGQAAAKAAANAVTSPNAVTNAATTPSSVQVQVV